MVLVGYVGMKKIEFLKIVVPKFNAYILVLIFFIAFIKIFIMSCLTFDLNMIIFPKSCLMGTRHIGLLKDVFFLNLQMIIYTLKNDFLGDM